MLYTFEYEETLSRKVKISANNLGEAIVEMERRIRDEEIVLSADDFYGAKLSMPVDENAFISVLDEGERIKDDDCMTIEIDWW